MPSKVAHHQRGLEFCGMLHYVAYIPGHYYRSFTSGEAGWAAPGGCRANWCPAFASSVVIRPLLQKSPFTNGKHFHLPSLSFGLVYPKMESKANDFALGLLQKISLTYSTPSILSIVFVCLQLLPPWCQLKLDLISHWTVHLAQLFSAVNEFLSIIR